MPRYPLAIIGPGALGLVFGERLAGRNAVALVARSEQHARELRAGASVDGRAFAAAAFAPGEPPQADWILVLVKARDTRAAAATAARMRPLGVLSLQNGWIEPLLREFLGDIRAAQGVTTEAAFRAAGEVHHTGEGETLAPPGFEPLVAMLREAGFRARTVPDIAAARLRKLLVNACINPLTALHRIPNGGTLEPPYREQLHRLAREGAALLSAEGVRLEAQEAVALVEGVARATAKNRSSMLQDVEAGRETEAEYVTGALLAMAASHGLSMPTHSLLYRFLRGEIASEEAMRSMGSRSLAS